MVVASVVIRQWPETASVFALIFLALAVGDLAFCTYFSDHHEEYEWVGSGVIQLSAFTGVSLFILGFLFGINGFTRSRREGKVRLVTVLPPVLYFAVIAYHLVHAWLS